VHTAPIRAEQWELADDLIVREGRGETPFGLYVITADEPASELARTIERDVFYEAFGNTPDLLAAEYDRYEDASVFLCVVDHARRAAAGMLRLVTPSAGGFKSLYDLERLWGITPDDLAARHGVDLDLSSLMDMATLAVPPDYRGAASSGLVATVLYQGLGRMSLDHDLKWYIAILDQIVLRQINRPFGRPLTPIPGTEPMRYLDSPSSQPVYIDCLDYRARVGLLDPKMYAMLFAGVGLESVVSQPRWKVTSDEPAPLAAVG
jgi:Acetyltransferase (GNAT) domain